MSVQISNQTSVSAIEKSAKIAKKGRAKKIALLLSSTLTIMSGATISPSLPQMAEVFQDVPGAVFLSKLILTLPALCIALFAPLAGFMTDRLGRLKVLFPALVLYAIAGSSGFFLQNLYLILAGRAALGIAVAGVMTVVITLVGDYYKGEERQRFIGQQSAFMALGGAVYVGIGGFLADLHWSYPFLLYLSALIFLVVNVLALEEPDTTPDESAPPASGLSEGFKKVWPVLLVALLTMGIFYMLPVQLPFFLKEIGLGKNSQAGLAIACSTLASAVTALFYGKIRQRLDLFQVFAVVFSFMATGYLLAAMSSNMASVMVAMVFTGLGMGALMPNISTWLLQIASPADRGRFSGWLNSSLFLGQFLSPVLVRPVVNIFGLKEAFLTAGVVLVFIMLFFILKNAGVLRK